MGGCTEFFGRIGTSGRGFGGRRHCGPELKSGRRNTTGGNDYASKRHCNSTSGYSNAAGRDSHSTRGNGNASRNDCYSSSWNYDARSNHSEYYDAAGGNDESTEPWNDATERYSEHDQSRHHESWKSESFKPGNDNATQRFDNSTTVESTTVELESNETYAKRALRPASFILQIEFLLSRERRRTPIGATVGIVE